MQHNEVLLLTKYREIIRRDVEHRQSFSEKCRKSVEITIKEETEKRCKILRDSVNADIETTLEYIEKVELGLKNLLIRWLPNFDYDVEKNTEIFKNELLQRFQIYIPVLNLNGFRLNQEDIDKKCRIPESTVTDRRSSTMSIVQIEELQRQLKVLQDEYQEEEIRVLAGIKVRESESTRLNDEIKALESQMETLSIFNDVSKSLQQQ